MFTFASKEMRLKSSRHGSSNWATHVLQ